MTSIPRPNIPPRRPHVRGALPPQTGASPRAQRPRSAYGSVAAVLISLAVIGAALALDWEGSPVGRVYAVFNENVLDLKLNGQDHIQGTIQSHNMLPGEKAVGEIDLHASGTAQLNPSNYDLDFDFRHNLTGSQVDIRTYLILSRFTYGTDDLLADPGRNLIEEIDANPNLGNDDGKLSLKEMEAGANDLPLPGPASNPTKFSFDITFDTITPNSQQGKAVGITLVFQASDLPHEDLN